MATTKPTMKFRVFVDGSPIKKTFTVTTMDALWSQFNRWANVKGSDEVFDSKYLGTLGWRIPQGIAEVRKVDVIPMSRKVAEQTAEVVHANRLLQVREQVSRLQDQLERRRSESASWGDAADLLRVLEGLQEANRVLGNSEG